jgi:hypothetical protein
VEVSNWKSIERESEIIEFGYNWFRNSDGVDQTRYGEYSIGETVASQMLHGFFSINRYFGIYHDYVSSGKKVPYFTDATRLENLVAQRFDLEFIDEKRSYMQDDETTYKDVHIPVVPLARLFRVIQYPFRPIIQGREVFITDWTTSIFARKKSKTLVLFRKSLLKGATTIYPRSKTKTRNSAFPESLSYFNCQELVEEFLNSRGYLWHPDLASLFLAYMEIKFQEIRDHLNIFKDIWEDFLDFYKPKSISLPIDAIPLWVILLQACDTRRIASTCYLDGYPTISFWPVARNHDNSNWIAKRIAAYDISHRSQLLLRGVRSEQIEMIDYPAGAYFKESLREKDKSFDVIVMSYWPCVFSSLSDFTSPPKTLSNVLNCLAKFDDLKIAIKVRTLEEVGYVQEIINQTGGDVEILTGSFYEHIGSTRVVITGISSAVFECYLTNTDCIVFEPVENGYSDRLIATSKIIKRQQFCRTESELIKIISLTLSEQLQH